MKNFTIQEVEALFLKKYPLGEIVLNGITHDQEITVFFEKGKKKYTYKIRTPWEVVEHLELMGEKELLKRKGFIFYDNCDHYGKEKECIKCNLDMNKFSFLLN